MKSIALKKYAEALAEFAWEKKIFASITSELNLFSEKIREVILLNNFLNNPAASLGAKKQVLITIFGAALSDWSYNFVLLLISHHKLKDLAKILDLAQTQFLIKEKTIEVTFESIIPLNQKQRQSFVSVLQKLTSQEIVLKEFINADLIGGWRIKMNDKLIDQSLAGRLSRLNTAINQD